jgi:methylphosphotriester-DNA--protein-cysteine methyltransferase
MARPVAPLEPFVRGYIQLEIAVSGRPIVAPIPARSAPILEFTLGDPHDVLFTEHAGRETAHPCNIVGVQTYRRVELSMLGRLDGFVVLFQPGGLSALVGVPVDTLTNRHEDGRAVCGAWVGELRDRLGTSSSFAERVRHADQCLLRRRLAPSAHRGVAAAARALLVGRGAPRISQLVEQSGLSARQFERRFAAHVGMSPKLYARVVRFEAALKRKKAAPGLRWTDVAHELGYHDQMHMVHDFSLLAGGTPSTVAPEFDGTVNDADAASREPQVRLSLHPLLA